MSGRPFQVLVLCTGNSARSILAECAFNARCKGRVRAFSAGSRPKREPHPLALELLRERGFLTDGLRSKSWDEFSGPDAPSLDLVVTVCGNADREICPVWTGAPLRVHWGVDDPAACTGSIAEQRAAFARAWRELDHKVARFADLSLDALDPDQLESELRRIADDGPTPPG